MKRESEEKVEQVPDNNFSKLFKTLQQFSAPSEDEQNVYGQERFVNSEDDLEPVDYENHMNVKICGRSLGHCDENEFCKLINREGGICRCIEGYYSRKKKCVKRGIIPVVPAAYIENVPSVPRQLIENSEEIEPDKITLLVSVESKNIQLPENEASLTASVVPENENEKYSYLWSLVDKPENDKNGTITDQTRKIVKVSNLSEGLYRFKLTVTGQNSYGETFVNLTVLPAKRINIPPSPIITPKYQIIKLPNNKAVLDGSTSTDDDKIESYKWELVQGPINYSPTLQEQPTIELSDLKEPGNYTFKLTVTDSDNAENSTTAIIQVVEEIDYPPQSNAGADVILYLPHNNITLNGTLSTDDHQIVSWEWTKDASDESKAVDMQNTHTPFLSLSHLEEGIYTFELKVTDAKGQNSTSKVHVFVKPPTNLPPVARAGNNVTISLPLTWMILNANESTDDIKITQYIWRQLSGPSNSLILNANDSIANATSLTLGDYIFEVTVIDENNNNATDRVKITVIQGKFKYYVNLKCLLNVYFFLEKNAAPVAKILNGNRNVTLPLSVLIFNGSSSYDDLAIVNYSWTRESDSLAVGNVIGNSDHEPVLQLTNIVAGQYIYKLTVSDEQGLTGSEKVTITVFEDPLVLNLVEVILTSHSIDLKQQEVRKLYILKLTFI
jgi:PKD repeat protein